MLEFSQYIKVPADYFYSYDEGVYTVMEKTFKRKLDVFLKKFSNVQQQENFPSLPQDLISSFPFVEYVPFKNEIFIRKQDIFLLEKIIINHFSKNKSVLEIGGWNGWLTNWLSSKDLNVISVDIFKDEKNGLLTKKFHQNSNWLSLHTDVTKTNIYAKKFDIIILNHCLQFLSNTNTLALDYSQLLNENGKIIIIGMSFFRNAKKRRKQVSKYRKKHFEKWNFNLQFYESKGFFDNNDFDFFKKNNFQFTSYKFSLLRSLKRKIFGNKSGIMSYTNRPS